MTQGMTQGPGNSTDRTSKNLDEALATLMSELNRADAKANTVLALTSLGLAFLATRGGYADQPAAVLAVGASGAACLVVATVLLLITVRPAQVDKGDLEDWTRWATLEPAALVEHMRLDVRAKRIAALARLLKAKFRRLQHGVSFILAGLVLLIAAAVLSLCL
ncbi:Pycsar system effector family protein [Streptomyces sp. NPDC016845]|uniref:Pycsar system effector family protein n=1 Tax=Streptomyces sp. NPDC016845 TaxID=3364972 RepID=UPI0037A5123B